MQLWIVTGKSAYDSLNYEEMICANHVTETEDQCEMIDTGVDMSFVGRSDIGAVTAVLMSKALGEACDEYRALETPSSDS